MSDRLNFVIQLENFCNEAEMAAKFLYAYLAVQYAASESKELTKRLNRTPRFWNAHAAASQSAFYICMGRIFDTTSDFNIHALLDSFEKNLDQFSKEALGTRKREGHSKDPDWLSGYLEAAYVSTIKDVVRLRKRVVASADVYKRAVQPARHKYFAHREKIDRAKVQALFERGKLDDLLRLVAFLYALHTALWQAYTNGRKPILRITRYSVKSMYKAPAHGSAPHENIVADTRQLMEFMETATPSLVRKQARKSPRTSY